MPRSRRSPEFLLIALGFVAGVALLLIALSVTDGRAPGVGLAEAAASPVEPPRSAVPARRAAERKRGIGLSGDGTPILTVREDSSVALRDEPGGKVVATVTGTTEFDSPTVLSVAERRGNWVGVPTELLPNGRLGWVELHAKGLDVDSVGQSIVIDLSAMSGKLFRDDELERRWEVGVGAPGTPTPTGRFSVTDEIEGGLDPTYGCCAIALSATQPNLPPGWTGGDRIAIHGTSLPLGEANSTGCVHSGEGDLRALIEGVPLGTPVTIKA